MYIAGPSEHQEGYTGWTRVLECWAVSPSFWGGGEDGYSQVTPQQEGRMSGV